VNRHDKRTAERKFRNTLVPARNAVPKVVSALRARQGNQALLSLYVSSGIEAQLRFSCREEDHRHADNQIIHRDGRP